MIAEEDVAFACGTDPEDVYTGGAGIRALNVSYTKDLLQPRNMPKRATIRFRTQAMTGLRSSVP